MAPRTKKKYASEFKELHGFYRIETAGSRGNKIEEVKNSMMVFSQDKYYSLNYFIVRPSLKSSEELRYFVVDVQDIKEYQFWIQSSNETTVRCSLNLDLFCRRHECKKFYIRNLSRFIEDHLFFADEIFDLIPNIHEQQGVKFDRDDYQKCRDKYASDDMSVIVLDMRKADIILNLFKVNREKVTIIDDFPSLKSRKLAFTSATVEPVCSISPCGQQVMDPLFACLFMFQTLVCGISWEYERCEDDPDCMKAYEWKFLEALKIYASTDKTNFATLSSVKDNIDFIKQHACKKPHKAYPKPDHNFSQNKHTAMIPFSTYQELCAAYQLPVFRSFLWEADEKKDELPVWVTRVLLTAGWVYTVDYPEYIKNHIMSRLASVQPERGVSGPLYAFADKISNPAKNGNPPFYDQPVEPESNALSKQKKRNEMLQKKKEEKKKTKGSGPPDTNKRTPRTPAEQLVLEMRYQEHMEKTMAMEVEDRYYGMESLRTISLDKHQKERFQPPVINFPAPPDAGQVNSAKPRKKSSLPLKLDKYGTPFKLDHLSQEEADRLLNTSIGQIDMNVLYPNRGKDSADTKSENTEEDSEYKKLIVNASGSSESVQEEHKPEEVELEEVEPENPESKIFDKEIEWSNMDSSTADALIWKKLDENEDPSEMTIEELTEEVMENVMKTRTEVQALPPKASQTDASTQIDPTIIWCRKCSKTSDRCTAAQNDLKTAQNQLKNYEKKALRTDEVEKKLKEMNVKLEEKDKELEQKSKDMKKVEKTQSQTSKSKDKEIENLKKSLESKNNEIREVKSSLDVTKQNFEKMKESEATEKRINSELRCQIQQLNDELHNERLVTEATQPNDLLNQISRLRVEMDQLEMERDIVSHKDNEKQEALNELKQLKRVSDEIHERTRQQLVDETAKIRQLEGVIEALRKEMQSMETRESFDNVKRELETKLKDANTLLASKDTQHAMELRLLEKEVETGKQELAEKEVQYLRLMSHNSSMEASLNMCKQTMEKQSDQITVFMQEKSQVVSLQEKIRRLEYENQQQKLQIQRDQHRSSIELLTKIRNMEFEYQQQMSTIRTLSQLVTQNAGIDSQIFNNNPAGPSSSSTPSPAATTLGIRTTPPTDPFISMRKCFICHDPIKTTHQVISCKNCEIPSHYLCGQRLAMDNDPCWSCGKKFDQLE